MSYTSWCPLCRIKT